MESGGVAGYGEIHFLLILMSKLVTLVAILAAVALVIAITKGGISAPDAKLPTVSAGLR